VRRATITISRDLDTALRAYVRDQEVSPALTSVVQCALREYLSARGYLASGRPFRITPAPKGSGQKDISIRHDRYLAGK